MLSKVKELWPEAKPLESYPTFKPDSLQSQQALHPTTSSTEPIHNNEVIMTTTGNYKKKEADVPTETTQGYKAVLSLMRHDGGLVPLAVKKMKQIINIRLLPYKQHLKHHGKHNINDIGYSLDLNNNIGPY